MKVTAKTTFIHGSANFKRGETVEVSETVGKALIGAKLVREVGASKSADGEKQEAKAPAKAATKTATKAAAAAKA